MWLNIVREQQSAALPSCPRSTISNDLALQDTASIFSLHTCTLVIFTSQLLLSQRTVLHPHQGVCSCGSACKVPDPSLPTNRRDLTR